ncbi:MAG: DegV family protein [Eubacteriales bacterium]|nr:DegV family protein [Eubacteriales bacterium]
MSNTNDIFISADSTCDLSPELLETFDVSLLPLYITMGEKTYRDGVNTSPEAMFSYVARTGELPKTAAVAVADYLSVFSAQRALGRDVIHVDISADMSACYQSACIAAKEVGDNVYVVDSRNLSTGTGLLVLMARELARRGTPAEKIAEELRSAAGRVEASFVVDTLTYLHKGGRCSAVAALGANLLSLKPCIEVKDGRMGVGKKYKGTLKRCLHDYIIDRLQGREDIDPHRIFITYSKIDPALPAYAREVIASIMHFDEVLLTDAGCTISGHCGPGTLGILFMRKE